MPRAFRPSRHGTVSSVRRRPWRLRDATIAPEQAIRHGFPFVFINEMKKPRLTETRLSRKPTALRKLFRGGHVAVIDFQHQDAEIGAIKGSDPRGVDLKVADTLGLHG